MKYLNLLLLLSLAACSTSQGLHRDSLRLELNAPQQTDSSIKEVLKLKPQLPRPFRLGVYFVPPAYRTYQDSVKWFWSDADKKSVYTSLQKWVDGKEISAVTPVIVDTGADSVSSLRLEAAQQGADAILVVRGVAALDQYMNSSGWSYVFILPTLFVSGTNTDVLFMTQAKIWDVKNEYLYLAAEAEAVEKRSSPFAYTNDRDVIESARVASLAALSIELDKQIEAILKSSKTNAKKKK